MGQPAMSFPNMVDNQVQEEQEGNSTMQPATSFPTARLPISNYPEQMTSPSPAGKALHNLDPLVDRPFNDPFGTEEKVNQKQEVQLQSRNEEIKQQVKQQQKMQTPTRSLVKWNKHDDITKLESMMKKSKVSQQSLHDWDRKQMGLKKSHSKTMRLSRKSRTKIFTMLRKERTLKHKLAKRKMEKTWKKEYDDEATMQISCKGIPQSFSGSNEISLFVGSFNEVASQAA